MGTRDVSASENMVRDYEAAATMQAVGLTQQPEIGHIVEHLEMITVATPRPDPDEVAIQVVASSMNIDEIYAAQGTALGRFRFRVPQDLSPENPHIMGSAVSGFVVGLGEDVTGFAIGDEVMVIPDKGPEADSWAKYRCVGHDMVMHKPTAMSHQQSAATTLGACVAWRAVKMSGVRAGDHCIVVGASGSIGAMVMAYLKSLDCTVTAVGSGAQADFMRLNGADAVVDYRSDNFADHVQRTGRTAAAVFDCVGGRAIERDGFRALDDKGAFVTVVGPRTYVGETRLSWPAVARLIGYVVARMATTRFRAKRYMFGATPPRRVIDEALDRAIRHGIYMPIAEVIPFSLDEIKRAVTAVVEHRAEGRIVIALD